MKNILLILLTLLLLLSNAFAAEVRNEVVKQAGNRMMFEFDVIGDADEEAEVEVTLTINGQTYTEDKLHLEGDIENVKVGKGRKIYWNVLQDFPRGLNTTFDWELEAGGKEFKDTFTGMEFVFVKGGCYQMGCGDWTSDCFNDKKPVHEVCVNDFYIGKYEVTVGEFRKFVNDTGYQTEAEKGDGCYGMADDWLWEKKKKYNWRNVGFSQTERDPVVCVSWNDTNEYIGWLNKTSSKKYRLPTDAEWEYSARSGGKKEKWAGTSNESDIGEYAWYSSNSGSKTHPVGQKSTNGLGIYDMSGNVWEWVQNLYYLENSPNIGIQMLRGGSWREFPKYMHASDRWIWYDPYLGGNIGFRLLRTQ